MIRKLDLRQELSKGCEHLGTVDVQLSLTQKWVCAIGNLLADGHLSNFLQLGPPFAPLAHKFAHLGDGDMPHEVPVISAVDACMTEKYTHSPCRAPRFNSKN